MGFEIIIKDTDTNIETVIFTASETQEQIVCSLVPCYREWIKAGVVNIIGAKIESAMEKLDKEWVLGGKLASNGVDSIPTDKAARAALIFEQPDYKSRAQKDLEPSPILDRDNKELKTVDKLEIETSI